MQKSKHIILISEFSKTGGTRIYFDNLIDFYKESSFLIIIVLEKYQLQFLDISSLNYPNIKLEIRSNRIYKRYPFSLLFDFSYILKLKLKYRIENITLSIQSPGSYMSVFIFSKKINYIIHSKIDSQGKRFYRIANFLGLFRNKKKKIICVSDYSKQQVGKYWKYPYCEVLNNFSRFNNAHISTNFQNKKILSIGQICDYKNTLMWIETAIYVLDNLKLREDISFIWIGEGEFEMYEKMIPEKYTKRICFEQHSKFIEQYLANSVIYFHPSLIENLSLAIIEAMSFSLPIVAFDTGGNHELIRNNENGFLVDENKAEIFGEKVIHLLENKASHKEMSYHSYSKYRDSYSKDVWRNSFTALN